MFARSCNYRCCALDGIGSSFFMSAKNKCHLRTLRREWGLTQKEVASLIGASRNRVSNIERGLVSPKATEIIAFGLVFGAPPKLAFAKFHTGTVDQVMEAAYRLNRRLEGDASPGAKRKRELTERILARATGKANTPLL